jgi:hypothetical protein
MSKFLVKHRTSTEYDGSALVVPLLKREHVASGHEVIKCGVLNVQILVTVGVQVSDFEVLFIDLTGFFQIKFTATKESEEKIIVEDGVYELGLGQNPVLELD